MTDVSLEFVSRQLDRVLDRLGAIEDQITVLTGMTMRHDGSLAGLAVEIRGFNAIGQPCRALPAET
jgi:hypothetical protein